MGRRGSGGGGRSFPSVRRPAAPKPAAAAQKSTPPAPVQPSSGGLFGGSISSTIADGLAWGASNEIAHRFVDRIWGPRTIRVEEVGSEAKSPVAAAAAATSNGDACGMHSNAFQDCLNSNGSDISKCQFFMDMLADCKRNSGAELTA